jgi:hypothetical protein
MARWYQFRAQAGGAEIVIYDEIGAFGSAAKAFLDELKALGRRRADRPDQQPGRLGLRRGRDVQRA